MYQLWSYCDTQLRVGFASVVGIDYNVLFKIADVLGIEITPAVLRKTRALEKVMQKEVNGDGKGYKCQD